MANIFRQNKVTKIPKGVYLWGTVGGGKTMLMDMFFDTVGLSEDGKEIKRRLHYHDFMEEVHSLIFQAKKNTPARYISNHVKGGP